MSSSVFRFLRSTRPLVRQYKFVDQLSNYSTTFQAFQLTRCNSLRQAGATYERGISLRVPTSHIFITRHVTKGAVENGEKEPPGLFKRFKIMYRDYWYVLVPVHVVTSAVWFGGFYYMAKSGVDVVAFMQTIHVSESFVEKLKSYGADSTAGHIAISYTLYKVFTPLRYMVTLGGTTMTIKYLTTRGFLQPIPGKHEIRKMLESRRDSLKEKGETIKSGFLEKFPQKKR